MYVTSGMSGPGVRVNRGVRVIPVPGASGSDQNSCTSPNYWNYGKSICCAPTGTPPAADPCSILNDPGYLAAQAADVGPLGANGVPLSTGGVDATILASLVGYDNNTQHNAIQCWSNPGATFVDPMGTQITCPSPSLNDNGILISAYSQGQLAAMLASVSTPKTAFAGDAPFASYVNTAPAAVVTKPRSPLAKASADFSPTPAVPNSPDSLSHLLSTAPPAVANLLTGSVSIAGMSFPTWGLIAAGVAAFWFLGGKH